MEETPVSLFNRLREGPSEKDWRDLDALCRPFLLRFLRRDPRLWHEAEDLAQEILLVAVKKLPSFSRERDGSFRRWLRVVAGNKLTDHHRRRVARPQTTGGNEDLLRLADPDSEASRTWDAEFDAELVGRALEVTAGEFSAAYSAAFRRYALDGVRPAGRVAEEVGMSVGSVYRAVHVIRARLRELLEGFR